MERPLMLLARLMERGADLLTRWDTARLERRYPPEDGFCAPLPPSYAIAIGRSTERDCGYSEAPMLAAGERPWPVGWERERIWETCPAHEWERTVTRGTSRHATGEFVIRCHHCHVPRCGHSDDTDPCMLRRHHTVDPTLDHDGHLPLSVLHARGG